jgi:hypothetical protein
MLNRKNMYNHFLASAPTLLLDADRVETAPQTFERLARGSLAACVAYATSGHLEARGNKDQILAAKLVALDQSKNIELPLYFYAWLSGFIEAEGNFSLVFNDQGKLRKSSFSMGQKDDLHILNMIKFYFKSENKIIKDKIKISFKGKTIDSNYYRFHLYNALSRKLLFEHFEKYPLLGEKKLSYIKFFEYHNLFKQPLKTNN